MAETDNLAPLAVGDHLYRVAKTWGGDEHPQVYAVKVRTCGATTATVDRSAALNYRARVNRLPAGQEDNAVAEGAAGRLYAGRWAATAAYVTQTVLALEAARRAVLDAEEAVRQAEEMRASLEAHDNVDPADLPDSLRGHR